MTLVTINQHLANFVKVNLTATTDPTASDDSSAGYSLGSYWINTVTDTIFFLTDDGVGAAVWESAGTLIVGSSNPIDPLDVIDVSEINFTVQNNSGTNGEGAGIGFSVSTVDGDIGAAIVHERTGANSVGDLHFGVKPTGAAGLANFDINMTLSEEGRLGLGNTAPTANVDLSNDQNGTTYFLASNITDGTLSRAGYAISGPSSGAATIYVTAPGYTAVSGFSDSLWMDANENLSGGLKLVSANVSGSIELYVGGRTSGDRAVLVDSSGNVGINTDSPVSYLEVEGGSADWDETTPGTTPGSIHLDPGDTTNNFGSAITFGASDSGGGDTAQAGIYVRSDNTYGTKMYIATTDSFVSGSKTAIMIDYTGHVGMNTSSPGGTLPNTFLSDADSRVLQISSGTTLTDTGLLLRRSDNQAGIDVWADGSTGICYIDSRWDSSTVRSLMFRTRTHGTPVNAMTIEGSGEVGINTGTDALAEALTVKESNMTLLDQTGILVRGDTDAINTYTAALGFGNATIIRAGMCGRQESADADVMGLAIFTHPTSASADACVEQIRITAGGDVGVNNDSPDAKFHVSGDGIFNYGNMTLLVGADGGDLTTVTDATLKRGRIGVPHYTNAEEPVGIAYVQSTGTTNILSIGGGSSLFNAATSIQFYTATTDTTQTGTLCFMMDTRGNSLLGTSTSPTGTNGKVLAFGDNAGDPTMGTNTAGIYGKDVAGTVEMFAIDEAGNTTQLSPHDQETGEWVFFSRNTKTGKVVKVDMERFFRDKFPEYMEEYFDDVRE